MINNQALILTLLAASSSVLTARHPNRNNQQWPINGHRPSVRRQPHHNKPILNNINRPKSEDLFSVKPLFLRRGDNTLSYPLKKNDYYAELERQWTALLPSIVRLLIIK